MLFNHYIIHGDSELLTVHVDGGGHVLIYSLGWKAKLFAEDIQHRVTPNEAYQVIAAALRLRQRMFGRLGRSRKSYRLLSVAERHHRSTSLQLGIAIPSIMLLFKDQRFVAQFIHACHNDSSKKTTTVVVIELFNHAVTPGFGQRNEPGLNSICQTKTDQTAHSSRVSIAAMKDQFIIYLLMLWYSQTPPVRPNSVDRRLRGLVQNRRHRTPTSCDVYAVHTVEAQRPTEVTRPNIVALMHFINELATQLWIALTLRLVASSTPMRQPFSSHYPAYRSDARQRRDLQRFQLPTDRLRAA